MKYTKAKNTYFAKPKDDWKDRIELEVGDSKQPEFYPQYKMMRWDNEVNFSARLKHEEKNPTYTQTGNKIHWKGSKIEAKFYELDDPTEHPEGGYEFEIILKEKPKTNKIEFTINTKGLDFWYQKPLTKKNIDEGDIQDEKSAGSYAIYADETINTTNYEGGKLYRCGKVGHIFRPKIIDAKGKEVWGELNIDKKAGIMTVTIPQSFLNTATYPVRHAGGHTFGYTTAGTGGNASITTYGPYRHRATVGATGGTVTSITAYINPSGNAGMKGAVYSGSNVVSNGTSNEGTTSVGASWQTVNYSTGPAVSASTNYYLAFAISNSVSATIAWDDPGNNEHAYDTTTYGTFPDPWSSNGSGTRQLSIYATYSISSASSSSSSSPSSSASSSPSASPSSTPLQATYGYFAGGCTTAGNTKVATADRIVFSTGATSANTVSNLSEARWGLGAVSDNSTYGYFSGGSTLTNNPVVTADRIVFSTGVTSVNTVSRVSVARFSLTSVSDGSINGYFAGGYSSAITALTDKIVFSSGTTSANTVSNLSQAKYDLASVSNGLTYGYFAGGCTADSALLLTVDRIVFSSGVTSANTVSALSLARKEHVGISDGLTYGYFAGGYTSTPSGIVKTVDRIVFSTEAISANTVSNLDGTGYGPIASVSDAITYGYFAGGYNNAAADRMVFSTGVISANTVSNLSQGRSRLAGISDNESLVGYEDYTKGDYPVLPTNNANLETFYTAQDYIDVDTKNNVRVGVTANDKYLIHQFKDFVGTKTSCNLEWEGQTNVAPSSKTVYLQIYNINSSTWETVDSDNSSSVDTDFILTGSVANLTNYKDGNALITCRVYQESTHAPASGVYGYFAGGETTLNVASNITDRIVFSTGVTSVNTVSNLSSNRSTTGVSDLSSYGYFAGGFFVATTDRITFSTGATSANTASNLSSNRGGSAGISDSATYGYFAGGATSSSIRVATTDRIVFSTSVTSANTISNLTSSKGYSAGLSDGSVYGYSAGGFTNTYVNTTDRISFSTRVTSSNTVSNLSLTMYQLAGVSDGLTYGYLGGGYTGNSTTAVDRIIFSTGANSANTASNLSSSRYGVAGSSDGLTYGYFAGGGSTTTDRITFSTGATSANTVSNLSVSKQFAAGLSDYAV